MKGPYERLKYDLRRVWECPACQQRTRTSGMVNAVLCRCQEDLPLHQQRWMRLLEDGPRRVGPEPGSATRHDDRPAAAETPSAAESSDS